MDRTELLRKADIVMDKAWETLDEALTLAHEAGDSKAFDAINRAMGAVEKAQNTIRLS